MLAQRPWLAPAADGIKQRLAARPAGMRSSDGWRWRTLAGMIIVDSACGILYAFSLYSQELQHKAGLSQTEIDLTVTMQQIGGDVGIHLGMVYDCFGPVPTLLLGAAFGFPAWFALYRALGAATWSMSYGSLLCLSFLQGHAQLLGDVVAVASVLSAFPDHGGLAVGLAKTFLGLSGSLASQVYVCFFAPDVTSFLLFIACEWLAVCLIGAALARQPQRDHRGSAAATASAAGRWLLLAMMVAVCLVLVLTTASLVEALAKPPHAVTVAFGAVALTVFALLCAFVATRREPLLPPPQLSPHEPTLLHLQQAAQQPEPGCDADDAPVPAAAAPATPATAARAAAGAPAGALTDDLVKVIEDDSAAVSSAAIEPHLAGEAATGPAAAFDAMSGSDDTPLARSARDDRAALCASRGAPRSSGSRVKAAP